MSPLGWIEVVLLGLLLVAYLANRLLARRVDATLAKARGVNAETEERYQETLRLQRQFQTQLGPFLPEDAATQELHAQIIERLDRELGAAE